jgi:hypothetical protein
MTRPALCQIRRRAGAISRATAAAALALAAAPALGQSPPSRSLPTPEPLARALEETQSTGRITVAVGPRLADALRAEATRRQLDLDSAVLIAPVLADPTAPAAGAKPLGEIRVYRAGGQQPEMLARLDQAESAAHALEWLTTLPAPDTTPSRDDEVSRTTHGHHHAAPSPQVPYTAPPTAPPPTTQLMIQGAPQAAYVQAPAPQPIVVQTPSPSVVLQQTPPTIYVAQPSQPANIQILAAPAAAPAVSVIQPTSVGVAAPTAVQPQLFLAQPAAAPAPVAAPAVAPALAYAVPAAAPAPAMFAAPSATAMTTTVREVGPGPIGRLLGGMGESMIRMGDHLAKHKASRLVTRTEAVPVAAPVQYAAPAPTTYQAVPQAAPPAQATPQTTQHSGFHGLFHKR